MRTRSGIEHGQRLCEVQEGRPPGHALLGQLFEQSARAWIARYEGTFNADLDADVLAEPTMRAPSSDHTSAWVDVSFQGARTEK